MKTLSLVPFAVLALFSISCNDTKFRAGAAQNAPVKPEPVFTCSINPGSVEQGQALTIKASVEGDFQGTLLQRARVGDKDLGLCGRLGSLAAGEIISHVGARPSGSLQELAKQSGLL